MPSRIIRDGIIESVAVNNLHWEAELFYRRLMSVVDDYGRYSALPQLLVSRCYPLQVNKVTTRQVTAWLNLCSEEGLIVLYQCTNGKPLLEIQQFNQRTRTPSKFPANLGESCKRITDARQMTVEDEDEVEDEDDTIVSETKTKAGKIAHLIPGKWKPTQSHKERAEAMGVSINPAAEYYRNWCNGKGVVQVCWNSAFTNALNGWLGKMEELKQNKSTTLDPLGKPIRKWK